jgi:hypothetical protein
MTARPMHTELDLTVQVLSAQMASSPGARATHQSKAWSH